MRKLKHIALLVDGCRAYGRGIFRGVAEFARERDDWLILPQERNLSENLPGWLQSNRVDGIIAFVPNADFGAGLCQFGVPVVDVCGEGIADIHAFDSDPEAISRLASDFLLRSGFSNFAFCGYPGVFFSDRRQSAFARQLETHGHEVRIYNMPNGNPDYFLRERSGMEYEPELQVWLAGLPKPIAVFACNDVRGQQIINACRESEIDVPGAVAVMGVDNDDMLCELSRPSLSSIEPDTHRIGRAAAELLVQLLAGRRVVPEVVNIPPLRVVERQSTDIVIVDNPVVLRAIRIIRNEACLHLSITQLCDRLGCSRTTLDFLFLKHLGRTASREIILVRLNRAASLLTDTTRPLNEIAIAIGFPSTAYFCRFFKRETGQTASSFRFTPSPLPRQ
jgi:LacI family transcriptional regulator